MHNPTISLRLLNAYYGVHIIIDSIKLSLLRCFFPTHTPKDMIKVTSTDDAKQTDEAITWFKIIYPKTQRSDWPPAYKPVTFDHFSCPPSL